MKKLCYVLMALCIIVIGMCVFAACNNEHPELKMFNYSVDGDEITIKNVKNKYKNTTEIIIPSGVTCIGERAFDGCNNLQSLTFSDTVSSFDNNAFYDCKDTLESLIVDEANTWIYSDNNCIIKKKSKALVLGCKSSVIPADGSVVSIGNYAFAWSHIAKIIIPDSVIDIGVSAFEYCKELTNISFGKGVESIGKSAFSYCDKIEVVNISDLTKWCEMETDYAVISKEHDLCVNSKLITELIIPEGVTKIAPNSFYYCKNIIKVKIPDSVLKIGSDAFLLCKNIESVDFGQGVKKIGSQAFANCYNLAEIVMPDSVTEVGKRVFSYCTNLKSVKISNNIDEISDGAFVNCASLAEIVIPDSVEVIGNGAFGGCSLLTKVELPSTVKSINNNSFQQCLNLREIIIPESVESIGLEAFDDTEWYLRQPNGVVYAGKFVYRYKGTMPKDCTTIALKDDTKGIVEGAFSNCESLVNISIPDSVAYIGRGAFAGCVNLETIYIGSNSSLSSYDLAGGNWIENCSAEIVIIQSKQG